MLKEFKEFINRGNVADMAVGVIIGGAFGKIVTSLVEDIIMPIIGILTGGMSVSNLFIALDGAQYASIEQAKETGVATLNYGNFIQVIIDFLIIAFVIFLFVKQLNKLKTEEAPKAPTTKTCPYCKTEINIDAVRCPNCTSKLNEE